MAMNMSYCQMENTASALSECVDSLAEAGNLKDLYDSVNEYEKRGIKRLLKLMDEFREEVLEDETAEEFIERVLEAE